MNITSHWGVATLPPRLGVTIEPRGSIPRWYWWVDDFLPVFLFWVAVFGLVVILSH